MSDCLDSILTQTFTDFEIILVDDSSTDYSLAIAKRYAERDSRIKLRPLPYNHGVGFARDYGLKHAAGEYITFIDPDDAVEQHFLEILFNYARNNDADVVSMGFQEISGTNRKIFSWVKEPIALSSDLKSRLNWYLATTMCCWCKLYKRSFIVAQQLGFLHFNCCAEEHLFGLLHIITARRYVVIPHAMYLRRLRDDSLTHDDSPSRYAKQLEGFFISFGQLSDYLEKFQICVKDSPEYNLIIFYFLRSHFSTYVGGYRADATAFEVATKPILEKKFHENSALLQFLFNYFFSHWQTSDIADDTWRITAANSKNP